MKHCIRKWEKLLKEDNGHQYLRDYDFLNNGTKTVAEILYQTTNPDVEDFIELIDGDQETVEIRFDEYSPENTKNEFFDEIERIVRDNNSNDGYEVISRNEDSIVVGTPLDDETSPEERLSLDEDSDAISKDITVGDLKRIVYEYIYSSDEKTNETVLNDLKKHDFPKAAEFLDMELHYLDWAKNDVKSN